MAYKYLEIDKSDCSLDYKPNVKKRNLKEEIKKISQAPPKVLPSSRHPHCASSSSGTPTPVLPHCLSPTYIALRLTTPPCASRAAGAAPQ